jgi:ankyrin repeat protein
LNNVEIVTLLLENGADPSLLSTFNSGTAPLHFAVAGDSVEAIQAMLDGGADVDIQTDMGLTPLMDGIRGSSPRLIEIVTILLDGGADLNVQDNSGNTALHHAVRSRRADVITLLLEYGAVPDIENNFGKTALDLATTDEIAEMLREAGAGE